MIYLMCNIASRVHVTFIYIFVLGHAAYLLTAQRDKPFLQTWAIHQHDVQQIRLVVPGKVTAMTVNPSGQKYCVIGEYYLV